MRGLKVHSSKPSSWRSAHPIQEKGSVIHCCSEGSGSGLMNPGFQACFFYLRFYRCPQVWQGPFFDDAFLSSAPDKCVSTSKKLRFNLQGLGRTWRWACRRSGLQRVPVTLHGIARLRLPSGRRTRPLTWDANEDSGAPGAEPSAHDVRQRAPGPPHGTWPDRRPGGGCSPSPQLPGAH